MSGIDVCRPVSPEQIIEGSDPCVGAGAGGNHLDAIQCIKREGLAILFGIHDIGHFRMHEFDGVAQAAMGTVDQRILFGHRDGRNTRILCGQSKQAAWRAPKANSVRKPQCNRLNAATNDIEGSALKRWVLLARYAIILFHLSRIILASV